MAKLSKEEINSIFIRDFNNFDEITMEFVPDPEQNPMQIKINKKVGLPTNFNIYSFNATNPPGGRIPGEHKIQLIVPNQARGERGSFNLNKGFVLLIGYISDDQIYVFWDPYLHQNFSYSKNLQVKPNTIHKAIANGLAKQIRNLRGGYDETVIACRNEYLLTTIKERYKIYQNNLLI